MINRNVFRRQAEKRREVERRIRRECETGHNTVWISADWYDVMSREEIQEILNEYGYGEMKSIGEKVVFNA